MGPTTASCISSAAIQRGYPLPIIPWSLKSSIPKGERLDSFSFKSHGREHSKDKRHEGWINKRITRIGHHDVLSLQDQHAIAATVLDPHYKTHVFPESDKETAINIFKTCLMQDLRMQKVQKKIA